MLGLWRKELRAIRPFTGLVLVVILFGVLHECFSSLPNARPMASAYEDYIALGRGGTLLSFILVFALASGLLIREFDEDTMPFLDSLPVSRSSVFSVKVTAALLVVLLFILLDVATGVVLHALSRNSLDPSFHSSLLITAVVLRFCQLFVILSLGLALSFLRRFGWLVLGLLFWVYILLHDRVPGIAVLNVFELATPRFDGDRWIVPYRLLAVQLTLGAAAMAIAYGMFVGWGDGLLRGFRQLTKSRLGNAALLTGGILVTLVGGGLVFRFLQNEYRDYEPDENGVSITYPSWSTSRSLTEHYQFVYPTNLADRAGRLVEGADSAHEKVRAFLSAEPGNPIYVDATSMMPRHAGVAYWDKIRLDLSAADDGPTLLSILGHETVHVYLERVSEMRLSEQMNSTRFFHEGVASYVEYHLFEPSQNVDKLRSVAAVMRARDEVSFSELTNSKLLSARRDTDLVYPLGEVFVEAIVERYGEPAIGKIVRALVRDDAPRDLTGQELWRDVFQACDFNLDEVIDEFYATLDAEVERHQELVRDLPRVRGALFDDRYWVYVDVRHTPLEGWTPICRFRQSSDAPTSQYFAGQHSPGATLFSLERTSFPSSTVWYQVGLSDGQGRVIYEPWSEATLD